MSEKKWHPFKEIDTLRHQINHLFDELIHGKMLFTANGSENSIATIGNATWEPAIKIKETDSSIILQVQVPGIESKDLEIDVSKNAVSITGEHQEQKVHYETGVYYSEFDYGHFQRIVRLPICVEQKQVKAEIHNGILTLNLPKSPTENHNTVNPLAEVKSITSSMNRRA